MRTSICDRHMGLDGESSITPLKPNHFVQCRFGMMQVRRWPLGYSTFVAAP